MLLLAWLFRWDVARMTTVAPIIVVAVGAGAGVAVLLGRAAWESLRLVQRPRLVFGLVGVAVVVLIVLGLLGVQLPRE